MDWVLFTERLAEGARRIDNRMAAIAAALGTAAFCLMLGPAIVAAVTGVPS